MVVLTSLCPSNSWTVRIRNRIAADELRMNDDNAAHGIIVIIPHVELCRMRCEDQVVLGRCKTLHSALSETGEEG
jgi:hypothetical protein